tara:strand:+ start:11736 stop:12386 length:651 start_codon:yes stop_codon:yes gene_type:complete
MATLNEIAYNIKNIVEGGVGSDDSNLSLRQVKYLIHSKRAELLLKYTDNGRKTSEAFYQVDILNVSSLGADYKPYLGFNNNKAIRSVVYKESSDLDEVMELLPVVQNHDRMFVQQSRFIKKSTKKYASLSDGKIFVFEDDSILEDGILEFKAIFSDPTTVSSYVSDDKTQYPMSQELLSILTQEVVSKEISLLYNLSRNTPNNQTDERTQSKEIQR